MNLKSSFRLTAGTVALGALAAAALLGTPAARAEFGDVVMNNYSSAAGMRPVVFPHWFHRIRFRCNVCHSDLNIKLQAGGNQINMLRILDGQYCGACHDGGLAWSVENCSLCHTGVPNMPTQVHESTIIQQLAAPAQRPARAGLPQPAVPGQTPRRGATQK